MKRLHVLAIYLLIAAIKFLDWLLANDRHYFLADPITISWTTILITTAISAGLSAGSYFISRALAPKPQGRILGKLYGDMQLSDSSWNNPIPEIYGARPAADEAGGCRLGTNIIWATQIREHRTTVPGSGGGGGKGGAPEPPPDTRITYDLDFAAMVGFGPLRVLQIKANEDVLYNALAVIGPGGDGNVYEAEDVGNTLAGGASVEADGDCSGGFKVTGIGNGGSLTFNGVTGGGRHPIQIFYKSNADTQAYVKVNGGAPNLVIFPNSGGLVLSKLILRRMPVSFSNTIEFYNPDAACPDIDYIAVSDPIDITIGGDDIGPIGPLGLRDDDFPAEAPYDHFMPPDPKEEDTNGWERFNRAAVEVDGVLNVTLANGALCTIYEGNTTQMPDPLISADVDTRLGAGSTPGYRGRCYLVFQNFDITKYGTMPNINVMVEHKTITTVKQTLEHRAQRAGLSPADINFDACANVKLRGYPITQIQSPAKDMQELGDVFNFAFVENFNGEIEAKNLTSRDIAATVEERDLGAYEHGGEMPKALVETTLPEGTTDLPQIFRVGFINPLKEFQNDDREEKNENARSVEVKQENYQITLLPDEATNVAQRMMQKTYHEATPHSISLQHKYGFLQATNRINLPVDGETRAVRIKEITGSIPGVLRYSTVDDSLTVFAGNSFAKKPRHKGVVVPVNSVVTFCDIPRLREKDNVPGIYVFATPRDLVNGVWNGAALFRNKGEGYRQLAVFDAPCTMGRCNDELGEVPPGWEEGDWDVDSEVTIDLFYGSLESSTDEQVLDGANLFIIGNEVIAAVNCVRDSAFPNRWTLSRLQRRLKNSDSSTHTGGERACFLNSAARFVPLDLDEIGIERKYKCATQKQTLADVAELTFTWGGTTKTSMPAYDVIDSAVPAVSDAPIIKRNDQLAIAEWVIYIPRPWDYSFTADNVEIRFRDRSDDTTVRQMQIGNTTRITFPMYAFDCDIDYRWRNRYRENSSDGWSAWSTSAIAYGLNASTTDQNEPDSEFTTFENDSSDVSKAETRKTLY